MNLYEIFLSEGLRCSSSIIDHGYPTGDFHPVISCPCWAYKIENPGPIKWHSYVTPLYGSGYVQRYVSKIRVADRLLNLHTLLMRKLIPVFTAANLCEA